MPTYQYRCTSCGDLLEVVQKFTDPSLTECPECSGALKKVFNAVGVVFKGSGFYRTDSRDAKSGSSSTNGSSESSDKTSSSSGSGDSGSSTSESSTTTKSDSGSASSSSEAKPKAAAAAS